MIYDIIIIGGGPAGLTAGLYARRANKSVLIIEKESFGGQITHSPKVENIPGFISLTGNEFADKLLEQAMNQGAEIEVAEVTGITDGNVKTVVTDSGNFSAKAVIIATGAKHRMLGVADENDYVGNGISFCAVCDGAFYKDMTVAVIGGGNSAMQEALLLAEQCKKVIMVQNLDFLTGEKKLAEQIESKSNVEVIYGTVVDAFLGDGKLKGLRLKKESNGELSELFIDGVFIAIGLVPQNEAFKNVIELDQRGYSAATENCRTQTAGVFVAGDCRSKTVRQVTTAAADGAIAALAACDYVDSLK